MSTLSINSVQANPIPFRGQVTQNEGGIPYYKSNEGLKTGIILSIPPIFTFLSDLKFKNKDNIRRVVDEIQKIVREQPEVSEPEMKSFESFLNDIGISKEIKELFKNLVDKDKRLDFLEKIYTRKGKMAIPAAFIATACSVGTGVLIDHIRNKKAKETANQLAEKEPNEVLLQNKNVKINEMGVPYYNTKTGKGLGTLLGAGCGIVNHFLRDGVKKVTIPFLLYDTALFALGGLIVGSIYDGIVNKKSKETSLAFTKIA